MHCLKLKFIPFFICLLLNNHLLAQPLSLIRPSNGFTTSDSIIEFQWNSWPGTLSYEFEISQFPNFSPSAQSYTDIISPLFQLTISGNQVIYWHVRAIINNSTTGWSLTRKLTIFNPGALNQLSLWFRSDLIDTINGSAIPFLRDYSNNGNNAVQNINSHRPTIANNGLNKKPIIRYDGVDDYMTSPFVFVNDKISVYIFQFIHGSQPYGGSLSLINTNNSLDYDNYNSLVCSYLNSPNNTIDCQRVNTNLYTSDYLNKWHLYELSASNTNIKSYVDGIFTHQIATQGFFNTNSAIIGSRWSNFGPAAFMRSDIAEIIIFSDTLSDSLRYLAENYLHDKFAAKVNLGPDINNTLCHPIIDAGSGYNSYLWSTGETSQSIIANHEGTYSVTTTNVFGEASIDTLLVSFANVTFNQNNSIIICSDTSITISTNFHNNYSLSWSNGSTLDSITVSEPGSYWVTVTDSLGCRIISDTIKITLDLLPTYAKLPKDSSLCSGNTLCLEYGASLVEQYLWSNGSTNPCIEITSPGMYSITVTSLSGCTAKDSLLVNIDHPAPNANFSFSTACVHDTIPFYDQSYSVDSIITWYWNFGDSETSDSANPTHTYSLAGIYQVEHWVSTLYGCHNSIKKSIHITPQPQALFSIDSACVNVAYEFIDQSIIPLDDFITSWYWDFGDGSVSYQQNPFHQYTQLGIYTISLRISTHQSCQSIFYSTINILPSHDIPQSFSLLKPPDQYFSESNFITFTWEKSNKALYYLFQISTDSNFNTNTLTQEINTTSITKELSPSSTYYWKVAAYNLCLDYITSPKRKISTFTPLSIPGLLLWLSADEIDTINGSFIKVWRDRSHWGYNSYQNNLAKCPEYKENGINCKPLLKFDGVDDDLLGPMLLNKDQITVFIFQRIYTSGPYAGSLSLINTNNPLDYDNYSSLVCSYLNTPNNTIDCQRISTNLYTSNYLNNWNLYELTADNSVIRSYLNGEFTHQMPTQGFFNTNSFVIGSRWSNFNPGSFMNVDIAEIMIFDNKLNDTIRKIAEGYFSSKYISSPVHLRRDLEEDYSLCNRIIDAGCGYNTYLWSSGDTNQSINVNQSGYVNVTVTDALGNHSSDSLFVHYPNFKKLFDTTICFGDTIKLSTKLSKGYSFDWWNTSNTHISSDSILKIWQAGTYFVRISDTIGCFRYDSIKIVIDSFEVQASLGPPTTSRCQGEWLGLETGGGGEVAYLWNNGSDSSAMLIQHPGIYSVTVTNARGCVARDSVLVTLHGLVPVAAFSAVDSICLGESMLFTDLSQPAPLDTNASITQWQWNFGDGGQASLQNPAHHYITPGWHEVSLVITTDSGCVNTVAQAVYLYPLPAASFLTSHGCTGTPVPFSDHSFYPVGTGWQWNWNFGDPGSGANNVSTNFTNLHEFDSAGHYTVRLIVTSSTGCVDTVYNMVTILQAPDLSFIFSKACVGDSTQFTNTSELPPWSPVLSSEWDFGDGSPLSYVANPMHKYSSSGTYNVSMTLQTLQCYTKKITPVVVNATPVAAAGATDLCQQTPTLFQDMSSVSNGSINQWFWNLGNLGISYEQHVTLNFPDTGTYVIRHSVVSDQGCKSDTIYYTIQVFPKPLAGFSSQVDLTQPQYMALFTDQSSANVIKWLWNFGDGLTSVQQNPVHVYADSGLYLVSLGVQTVHGCESDASQQLQLLYPAMDVGVSNSYDKTTNGSIQFSADLVNLGTRTVSAIDMNLMLNGLPAVKEKWTGQLEPDSSLHYDFKALIVFPEGITPYYYCIRAELSDGSQDRNPTNNEKCKSLSDQFTFPDPYPNPVHDLLYLNFILPQDNTVSLDIVNALGQSVRSFDLNATKGLNQLKINTFDLSPGLYTLRLIVEGKVYLKRVTKN